MSAAPGHGHGHDHVGDRSAARSVGRLWVAFALTVGFVVIEAVTAFLAGSLALLSDAAHMLTDGAAIGLALGALPPRPETPWHGPRSLALNLGECQSPV